MSRTKPTEMETLELQVPCAWCESREGTWCTTATGRWADYLHGLRTAPIQQARWIAHQEAIEGLLCSMAGDEWERRWVQRRVDEHRSTCERSHS